MKTVFMLFSFMTLVITPTFASQHPFYEMSNAAKRELIANALKIKIGDSYRTIRTTLGAPTREAPIKQKVSGKNIGKTIVYSAIIWDENSANESQDEYILIVLNEKGLVAKIYLRIAIAQS